MIDKNRLAKDVDEIRAKSPLVHNITNFVVMNNSANALLAIGASPVMAHAKEEVEDMVAIAQSLVINIGTLNSDWVESMIIAGKAAHRRGKAFVLDPVGAGATAYRTKVCWEIINSCHPTVIRGNGSEIMALINADVKSKGVDSSAESGSALDSAKQLSLRTGAVVVISGATDYVTDGERVESISNGSAMMTSVTGLGCTASAMVGAFAAVDDDAFAASLNAMAVMGIAGEKAAAYTKGSGSLQIDFIDELYHLTGDEAALKVRQ